MSSSVTIADRGPGPRPQTLHISKSFSRLEPSRSSPLTQSRSSTSENGSIAEAINPDAENQAQTGSSLQQKGSVFEQATSSGDRDGSARNADPLSPQDQELPEGFDELPIELISLIDR